MLLRSSDIVRWRPLDKSALVVTGVQGQFWSVSPRLVPAARKHCGIGRRYQRAGREWKAGYVSAGKQFPGCGGAAAQLHHRGIRLAHPFELLAPGGIRT